MGSFRRYYDLGTVGGYRHWGLAGTFTITNTLTNLTNSNTAEEINAGTDYAGQLVGYPGYIPPETIVVFIGGAASSAYEYDSTTGAISIAAAAIYGDIIIIASGAVGVYSITNTLTNVTNLNTATEIAGLVDYVATLEAADGYDLPQVISVTIDGSAIPRSWNPATGELVIYADDITGDITIIAIGDEYEIWDGSIADSYCGGTGTEEDPYLICSGGSLALLAANAALGTDYEGVYFKQVKNIYLNDTTDFDDWTDSTSGLNDWSAIGNTDLHRFNGFYDGQLYAIDGVYMVGSANTDVIGLFGYVDADAIISNVKLTNTYTSNPASAGKAAGLCYTLNGALIGCSVDGKVTAAYSEKSRAAGVVYTCTAATISGCKNYALVTGGYAAGILCTGNSGATTTMSNCINYGEINGTRCGGIIATAAANHNISLCVNYGEIVGSGRCGGIAGYFSGVYYGVRSAILNCMNYGDVSGTSSAASGGIASYTYWASVINCANVCKTLAGSVTGGVIANVDSLTIVDGCCSSAETVNRGIWDSSDTSSTVARNCFWLYDGSKGASSAGYLASIANYSRFNTSLETDRAYQVDGAGDVFDIGSSVIDCLNAKAATIANALGWVVGSSGYPELNYGG